MNKERFIRTELPVQALQQFPSIQSLLIHLEGKGKAPNTRLAIQKALKALAIRADLQSPKDIEIAISRYTKQNKRPCSNSYKSKLCDAYQHYCKFHKIEWEKPIYTPEPTSIQPPSTEKALMLVSAAKGTLSMKIDIIQQTGLRPIEIQGEKGLQVNNIHPDQDTITAKSTKRCNPRPPLKITPELMTRLQQHIRDNNLQSSDLLFTGNARRFGEHYRIFRNRLANKLADPTIKTIRLYDLRHYYCTKQLRRTQNCEIVRQMMGHKQLNTTQKYMHLLGLSTGEWIVEGTNDKERAKQLLKEDFQYQLTTPDGTMIFRKPK